jgi:hypothetical protein
MSRLTDTQLVIRCFASPRSASKPSTSRMRWWPRPRNKLPCRWMPRLRGVGQCKRIFLLALFVADLTHQWLRAS